MLGAQFTEAVTPHRGDILIVFLLKIAKGAFLINLHWRTKITLSFLQTKLTRRSDLEWYMILLTHFSHSQQ